MIYFILTIALFINIYCFLTTIITLYPYYKKTLLLFIVGGLIFDIVSNTLFINTILFIIINYIIKKYYNYFKYNIYSVTLLNILIIFLYKIINYIVVVVANEIGFNVLYIFNDYKYILINIIYSLIIYSILKKANKYKKRSN